MKTLAKLPVTIVTGFLGSGKTTLLRHMLDNAQGRRIAVIVNEFGELGIDGEILKQCSIGCTEEEANGRVYELANGCLCCTVQEEFFPVMRELVARRGDLDHILIETSGLALPKPLVQAFQWPEIRSACTVDAVITVVDAVHGDKQLDEHTEAQEQVGFADRILMSKVDLADQAGQDRLRERLMRINPRAPIKPVNFGNAPIAEILDIRGFNLNAILEIDQIGRAHV